jgi:hypothetical protein
MNKGKKNNRFDLLVEALTQKFSEIKNFEIINESERTRTIWNFLVQTIVEFNSIKSLFVGIYIPQTNKFRFEWKKEFSESIYSSFLKIDDRLWNYEVYKLIRVAYVTIFHQYESFAGNIFEVIDKNYIEFKDKSISLEQYAKIKFDFKVDKEWYINGLIKKVNWVCNSEKHNDGFPIATHIFYRTNELKRIIHPETEQIKIQSEELKQDIEWIVEIIQMVFQNIMMIALYRMAERKYN